MEEALRILFHYLSGLVQRGVQLEDSFLAFATQIIVWLFHFGI